MWNRWESIGCENNRMQWQSYVRIVACGVIRMWGLLNEHMDFQMWRHLWCGVVECSNNQMQGHSNVGAFVREVNWMLDWLCIWALIW